jgi:hypothetical protein
MYLACSANIPAGNLVGLCYRSSFIIGFKRVKTAALGEAKPPVTKLNPLTFHTSLAAPSCKDGFAYLIGSVCSSAQGTTPGV